MSEPRPTYDDLLEAVQRLQRQVEALQADNARLRAELDEARRAAKRQAAPFAKGTPKPHPRKPGRKPGSQHGRHGHRPPPAPEQIDERHDAPLPDACPGCGGPVEETHRDTQFQTDIPRRPVVRRFDIHCGRCRACGRTCRGRHPLQTSDATGAAASQLGPDAQAAVVLLNKEAGLSHRKVARAFDALFGISLTRGACTQIVLRAGRRLLPAYQEVRQRLKESRRLTPDETGWRVGGQPVWLHCWVGDGATGYDIHPQRGAEALVAVIGLGWDGVLVHDGWAAYDRFGEAIHQQCVAHVLRRARELEQSQAGRAKQFPRQVITLFQGALQVRDAALAGEVDEAQLEREHLRHVNALLDLAERPRSNPANERLAQHLFGHAEQWLMFLTEPTLPATNYQAEQAIRPAVVNRKVWGGNRTESGAEAQKVLLSVLETCKQQLRSGFQYVRDTLCHGFTSLFGRTPTPAPVGR
jgi:transposase